MLGATKRQASNSPAILYAWLPKICPGQTANTTLKGAFTYAEMKFEYYYRPAKSHDLIVRLTIFYAFSRSHD
jgi:hypothetical protein